MSKVQAFFQPQECSLNIVPVLTVIVCNKVAVITSAAKIMSGFGTTEQGLGPCYRSQVVKTC